MVNAWDRIPVERARKAGTAKAASDDNQFLKRVGFGAIMGGLTGVGGAVTDVFRTKEGRSAENMPEALRKIRNYGATTALFFGMFHAVKQKAAEARGGAHDVNNIIAAAALTLPPLTISASTRPLLPYAAGLALFDGAYDAGWTSSGR